MLVVFGRAGAGDAQDRGRGRGGTRPALYGGILLHDFFVLCHGHFTLQLPAVLAVQPANARSRPFQECANVSKETDYATKFFKNFPAPASGFRSTFMAFSLLQDVKFTSEWAGTQGG